jgi:hypothetical protein
VEPFLITCPGCKIRLQITNPEFVGREFACPRCKTKLEVKEPSPEQRAAEQTSSSGETGHVTGTFRLGPPKNQSQDATTAVGEFADIESILTGASKPTSKWIHQPAPEEAPSITLSPTAAEQKRASQQRWTWLVFSIVGGTLGALMVTSLVIYILSANQENRKQRTVARDPAKKPETESPTVDPKENVPSIDPTGNEKPPEPENGDAPKVVIPSDAAPPVIPPAEGGSKEDPPVAPPGFDPAAPNDASKPPNDKPLASTIEGALKGSSLLPEAGGSPLRRDALGGRLEVPDPDPTIFKPKPRIFDVNRQLGEPIANVRADKLAMVDFLDLLSQLSGLPVSLDPAVITRGGVDPRVEVSVIAEGKSLRQIGETALRPIDLVLVELGGGLVATFPDQPLPQLDMTGVTIDAAGAADFEKFVRQSVDPARWGEPPQDAKLTLANNQIQFQGSPRVAMGVKKLLDELRAVAAGQNAVAIGEELLEAPVTFEDSRTLRLDDLVAKLESVAQCEIRIDWVSLGAVGWNQDTTASLTAKDLPLRTVLQRLCEPRGWGFRLLAPRVIELTTFQETFVGAEARVFSLKKQMDAGMPLEKIHSELAKAIAPAVPRGMDPMPLIAPLRSPAVVAIRGPASVQTLADAWLNAPVEPTKQSEPAPPTATAGAGL